MSKVSDPNAKSGNGFIWGVGVLLVIIAVVIGYIVWNGKQANEIEVRPRARVRLKSMRTAS